MRSNRFIRNRGMRRESKMFEMDITSLLDILVILLVFLLKSYNSSNAVMNIPAEITLPKSDSQHMSAPGVMVQVSPSTIWVDDKEILSSKKMPRRMYDMKGRRIIPLYNELVRRIHMIKEVQKTSGDEHKFSGIVNLIIDKSLKYSYLKKIMFTCAEAGFRKYKFVVMGEEDI